ncbi:hypothetical protein A2154_04965 [Candidatus Gottesmanbacteria bacterium RBG_16_43_7]|uniref:General secretion pathway GspH domain-containing protein n=1 Tax=Candidatus Gottesmanbacteria bacterium RBG_16_43_7 TaxID=1798373 RepID=A0A1F5ZDN2_9BACT|nr:MAG: hypothetical protein A2154_04965 [Candidatus Gottesmanbacteria bacterium RBG_16_43_7]
MKIYSLSRRNIDYSPSGKINSGFTLIEILVSIGIMMTLVGLGVAGYNEFNENQRVKQAALTLKNNIRLAQNRARSSIKPGDVRCNDPGTTYNGYHIWAAAGSQYSLAAHCTDAGGSDHDISVVIIDLSTDVTTSAFNILFPPVTSAITGAGDIVLTSGSGKSYQLTVSSSGDVSGPVKL